jgi:hypothetical protein
MLLLLLLLLLLLTMLMLMQIPHQAECAPDPPHPSRPRLAAHL